MTLPSKSVIKLLLSRYGRTFSEDLGLDPSSNDPETLFCMLVLALLFSARISHTAALESTRLLIQKGWTTPAKMTSATWEQRVKVLDQGGYGRFDERTATMLGDSSQLLIDAYGGGLRNLREQAQKQTDAERKLLKQFKGIGDLGASIFLREVQLAWPELFPFADDKVLASAARLDLPADASELRQLVRSRGDFARLVGALMRVQLDRKHNEIRSEISQQ